MNDRYYEWLILWMVDNMKVKSDIYNAHLRIKWPSSLMGSSAYFFSLLSCRLIIGVWGMLLGDVWAWSWCYLVVDDRMRGKDCFEPDGGGHWFGRSASCWWSWLFPSMFDIFTKTSRVQKGPRVRTCSSVLVFDEAREFCLFFYPSKSKSIDDFPSLLTSYHSPIAWL